MKRINFLTRLVKGEEGMNMVEYALLGSFISIVAIAVIRTIGPQINTIYSNILAALQ